MANDHQNLVFDAARALNMGQRELSEYIGSSRSTFQRLYAGRATLGQDKLIALAQATFPVDRAIAARAASLAGTTLEALGLVAAPVAAPPVPPAPPPPVVVAPKPPPPQVADSVLCAAAEAMNVPPQQLRPILRAAFTRARALGLTTEMVADAFERTDGV